MKQKMCLRFQTYNKESLEEFKDNLRQLSISQEWSFSSISLPIKKKTFTILRSPHVNKKAKDQFEIRLYNGLIILKSFSFEFDLLEQIKSNFKSDIFVKISVVK